MGWSISQEGICKKRGGGGGDVVEEGRPFLMLPFYPAISVAVVTSFWPSQMVLNCSGTGRSVCEGIRDTGVSVHLEMYFP